MLVETTLPPLIGAKSTNGLCTRPQTWVHLERRNQIDIHC